MGKPMNQHATDVDREARAAQEARVRDHPLLRRFAESRQNLASDVFRPLYHFVSPESTMNDPNGSVFGGGSGTCFIRATHRRTRGSTGGMRSAMT
jgi:hypothetical protein